MNVFRGGAPVARANDYAPKRKKAASRVAQGQALQAKYGHLVERDSVTGQFVKTPAATKAAVTRTQAQPRRSTRNK